MQYRVEAGVKMYHFLQHGSGIERMKVSFRQPSVTVCSYEDVRVMNLTLLMFFLASQVSDVGGILKGVCCGGIEFGSV